MTTVQTPSGDSRSVFFWDSYEAGQAFGLQTEHRKCSVNGAICYNCIVMLDLGQAGLLGDRHFRAAEASGDIGHFSSLGSTSTRLFLWPLQMRVIPFISGSAQKSDCLETGPMIQFTV